MCIQSVGFEPISSIFFCSKCNICSVSGDYKKAMFAKHNKYCDEKYHIKLMMNKVAQPYYLAICNNPVFEYFWAYGLH